MSSFAPPSTVICDCYFEKKNDKGEWEKIPAGLGVDALEAERLMFHPNRPKGSRFVCKIRR